MWTYSDKTVFEGLKFWKTQMHVSAVFIMSWMKTEVPFSTAMIFSFEFDTPKESWGILRVINAAFKRTVQVKGVCEDVLCTLKVFVL